jgi:hypothetical protein
MSGTCVTYEGKGINAEFNGGTDRERERRHGRPGCRYDYNKFLNFNELEREGICYVCVDQGWKYGDMM